MKARLQKILILLKAELERAENFRDDSENETTVERYEAVAEALEESITGLETAIDCWE